MQAHRKCHEGRLPGPDPGPMVRDQVDVTVALFDAVCVAQGQVPMAEAVAHREPRDQDPRREAGDEQGGEGGEDQRDEVPALRGSRRGHGDMVADGGGGATRERLP